LSFLKGTSTTRGEFAFDLIVADGVAGFVLALAERTHETRTILAEQFLHFRALPRRPSQERRGPGFRPLPRSPENLLDATPSASASCVLPARRAALSATP
jgi:hypothetical protein